MKFNTQGDGLSSAGSKNRWIWAIFLPVSAGLLFSGYLSAVKVFTKTCAFNEPCPYFWGYPACWYGFAMYLIMFVATSMALVGRTRHATALKVDLGISILGTIFAGNFTIQELFQSRITGVLGLSTCAYGFIFYVIIFALSIIALRQSRDRSRDTNPTTLN